RDPDRVALRRPHRRRDRLLRRIKTMETLLKDLRFAVRGLRRTPGFTIAAVLALALGIGATTAIFSVVHAVLMQSLGWGEESRLFAVHSDFPGHKLHDLGVSPPEFYDLR